MDFTPIKGMLYNLIKTYSGGVEAIWADQSEARPPRPYASMKIIAGPTRIGTDDELRQAEDGTFKSTGQRSFTLSVQFFGAEAMESASRLMSSLELDEARELMRTQNVGMSGSSSVNDLTTLLDNRFEQRYSLDLFMNCTDEVESRSTWIEHVEVTNEDTGDTQVIN